MATLKHTDIDTLEAAAYEHRQPIDYNGTHAYCQVGSTLYVAKVKR